VGFGLIFANSRLYKNVSNMAIRSFPLRELTTAIDAVARALTDQRRESLGLLGEQLVLFVQQAYEEKSRGGTGGDGMTWDATRRSEQGHDIGFDSGQLKASISHSGQGAQDLESIFTTESGTITVGYTASHARHFDQHRTLIPDRLPDAWQQELQQIAATRCQTLIETLLQDKGIS